MPSEQDEAASRVEEMLLSFGGVRVIRQDSELDELLLRHGELVRPRKVARLKGREHRCHRNASGAGHRLCACRRHLVPA